MRHVISTSVLCWMVLGSSLARAQSNCEAVLAQGIFDAYSFQTAGLSKSAFHNAMCNGTVRTVESKSDHTNGTSVSIGIPGIIELSLGDSREGATRFQDQYKHYFCGEASASGVNVSSSEAFRRVASPVVLQAYTACVTTRSHGLEVNVTRPNLKVVTFDLAFNVANSSAKFNALYLTPRKAARCRSANVKNGGELTATRSTITCSRAESYDNAFTVVLQTTAGAYTYEMPALPKEQRTAATPIGAIMPFAGSKPPAGWMVCDGRRLKRDEFVSLFDTIGYTYGGDPGGGEFDLPDLRGRFVRGLNGTAKGDSRDPDQKRTLGSLQGWFTGLPRAGWTVETTGVHHHSDHVGLMVAPGVPNTVHEETDRTDGELDIRVPKRLPDDGAHKHSITGGDPETRPVNLAVNYIIHVGVSPK